MTDIKFKFHAFNLIALPELKQKDSAHFSTACPGNLSSFLLALWNLKHVELNRNQELLYSSLNIQIYFVWVFQVEDHCVLYVSNVRVVTIYTPRATNKSLELWDLLLEY